MLWLLILATLVLALMIVVLSGYLPSPFSQVPDGSERAATYPDANREGYRRTPDAAMLGEEGVAHWMSADALANVTFDPAVRGYRVDQVDAVVAQLVAQIRSIEEASSPETSPQSSVAPSPGM